MRKPASPFRVIRVIRVFGGQAPEWPANYANARECNN